MPQLEFNKLNRQIEFASKLESKTGSRMKTVAIILASFCLMSVAMAQTPAPTPPAAAAAAAPADAAGATCKTQVTAKDQGAALTSSATKCCKDAATAKNCTARRRRASPRSASRTLRLTAAKS